MPHTPKPKKSHAIKPDERALFQQAMRGTTPLHEELTAAEPMNVTTPFNRTALHKQKKRQSAEIATQAPLGKVGLDGDSFYRAGVQRKTLQALKRGNLRIDDVIDLHGHDRRSASQRLSHFVAQSILSGCRCIRVITGKGRRSPGRESVIRKDTCYWLQQHPKVLAYCPAQPHDGGMGAFYVLLNVRI